MQDNKLCYILPGDYSVSAAKRIRANKWAAVALLARVYLYQKDWANAETTANSIIANNTVYSLQTTDINLVFKNNQTESILETHIYWYHNVMSILHDWYMIQAGAIDPRARKIEFDNELMGQLIRFVSSHEVGHTLGLAHNFGSSSTVPVDSLRNKKWVEAHGHTPSIMDYARFNYVAQPEDNIGTAGIYPRIGDYDKWTIEWGYRLFPDVKDAKDEKALLNKWVIDSLTKNPRLWYGPQTSFGAYDPRSQSEDLGDNAMKAGEYGIKNLKRIITQLPEWTREPNEGYGSLEEMFKQLLDQFVRYNGHVLNNIGGIYITPKTVEEQGAQYLPVPKSCQQQAMALFDAQVFTTPQWLFNKDIAFRIDPGMTEVNKAGEKILWALINRLSIVVSANRTFGTKNNYTPTEFLFDLKKSIWHELTTGGVIEGYRRDLQNVYINSLVDIPQIKDGNKPDGAKAEMMALVSAHLVQVQQEIKAALPRMPDQTTKAHLQFIIKRIDLALNPVQYAKSNKTNEAF